MCASRVAQFPVSRFSIISIRRQNCTLLIYDAGTSALQGQRLYFTWNYRCSDNPKSCSAARAQQPPAFHCMYKRHHFHTIGSRSCSQCEPASAQQEVPSNQQKVNTTHFSPADPRPSAVISTPVAPPTSSGSYRL